MICNFVLIYLGIVFGTDILRHWVAMMMTMNNDKNLCRRTIEGARLFRCLRLPQLVDSEKIEEPVSNLLSLEVYFCSSTEGIPLKERGSHDRGP